jgi:tetratricopeptide (TPR) repeat protein
MNNPTAGAVILIVDQENSLTPREEAVRTRLSEKLHFSVCVQDAARVPSQEDGARLLVVCSKALPAGARELPTPVLVCNVGLTFELGMTLAKHKVDYGCIDYSSVVICPDVYTHPLAGGMTGRHKVSEDRFYQGWGKPGPKALVVATVGGDGSKAVVFAHNKGDLMAAGLEAPQRRVAFLPTGGDDAQLTDKGWLLFDAAVTWAEQGGGPTAEEGLGGYWFLKDGTPTRTLSTQEYRDWVHEQVAWKVWKYLFAVVAFLGVGGITALLLAINSITGQRVDNRVDKVVKERIKAATERLLAETDNHTKAQVAELVLLRSAAAQQMYEGLGKKAAESFAKQLDDPATRQKVVEAAIEELYGKGKATATLVERYQKMDPNELDEIRKQTLLLILIHGNDEQKRKMHAELRKAILSGNEKAGVREVALKAYTPEGPASEEQNLLRAVVEQLVRKPRRAPPSRFSRGLPSLPDLEQLAGMLDYVPLQKAYVTFIAKFSDDHAAPLLEWLAGKESLDPEALSPVLSGLVKMKVQDPDDPKALKALVRWAVDDPSEQKRSWGINGLLEMIKDQDLEIKKKPRQSALEALLKAFAQPGEAGSDEPGPADGLAPPGPTDLRGFSSPGVAYRSILTGLLRPEDEDFVERRITPGAGAQDKAMQELLASWVVRLQKTNKALSPQVIDKLYRLRDALYGAGSAGALEYSLRLAEPKEAEAFLNRLPQLYLGDKYDGQAFLGQRIVEAALAKDAGSVPLFNGTVTLLCSLKEQGGTAETKRAIETLVIKTLTGYGSSLRAQTDSPGDLRAMLQSPRLKHDERLRQLLAGAVRQAYEALAVRHRRAGNYALAIADYSELIALDPGREDRDALYFQRGQLHFPTMGDYAASLNDLNAAIAHNKEKYEYCEARGDLYLNSRGINVDEAIKNYQLALAKAKARGVKPAVKGDLHRKLALAYILQDDEAVVKDQVRLASACFDSALDKARAEENLGLLYLRKGDWERASKTAAEVIEKRYYNMPWSWLIRYIAESQLGHAAQAGHAYREWQKLRMANNLVVLNRFVPDLLQKHLHVIRIEENTLRMSQLLPPPIGKSGAVHEFPVRTGKKYGIDMESSAFDSYLIVQDASGKEVARDDDSGGGLNARLVLAPTKTATYRVNTTSFRRLAEGAYSLIIRELPDSEGGEAPAGSH